MTLMIGTSITEDLMRLANPRKAGDFSRFFKSGPGQYGEGDKFLGINLPSQREIVKKYYRDISFDEIDPLVRSEFHEFRMTGFLILTYKMAKAKTDDAMKPIVDYYIKNIDFINNWDLVDLTADKILGKWLFVKDRSLIYQFAHEDHLWKQRIAVLTSYYFIKKGQFEDTLNLASLLLTHKHDLIHKAVGWMLREIGKRDFDTEYNFLIIHYNKMPRTMLRYAIEKFDPELRLKFLRGEI
jgi:3-methyladenine DNA glycosylase AlkD